MRNQLQTSNQKSVVHLQLMQVLWLPECLVIIIISTYYKRNFVFLTLKFNVDRLFCHPPSCGAFTNAFFLLSHIWATKQNSLSAALRCVYLDTGILKLRWSTSKTTYQHLGAFTQALVVKSHTNYSQEKNSLSALGLFYIVSMIIIIDELFDRTSYETIGLFHPVKGCHFLHLGGIATLNIRVAQALNP